MKRRGPGAARPLCGAALAAALLLPVAAAEQASAAPAADGKRQELPPMPSALDPRADAVECTAASREKAEKQDWSRQRLDLARAHQHGTGAGTTVALVDTGVSTDAAGLGGRVTARGAAGDDCVGHGTFLAGLIVGEGWGRTRLPGVAPEAELLALRGTDERGSADAALVAGAVRDATAAGADVIAVGVALPKRDEELTSAVAEAIDAGAVVVAAATPDPPHAGATRETPPAPTGRPASPECSPSPTCSPAGPVRATPCRPTASTSSRPAPAWSPAARAATATTWGRRLRRRRLHRRDRRTGPRRPPGRHPRGDRPPADVHRLPGGHPAARRLRGPHHRAG